MSCSCCHEHDEHEEHEEELSLKPIIVSAVIFAAAIVLEKVLKFDQKEVLFKIPYLLMYFAAYMICGKELIHEAVEGLAKGKVFSESFLMTIATVGAIFVGEYAEAVAVLILFQTGEFLEDLAADKTKDSIADLMDIRPDVATVVRDRKETTVDAEEVKAGETIVVKPGERIPLDGTVTKGTSFADTSALTGESVPRQVKEGDKVLSGFMNTNGVLEICVEKEFGQSTVSRVLEMVEHAQDKKSKSQKFISKFARYYTPTVCLLAVAAAVLPPLLTGDNSSWKTWIYRACEMLVVSCPCALVISVPLSFFAGIGLASKNGILIKGSNYIDALANAEIAVFDKTGTLTKGVFEVQKIVPKLPGLSEEELVSLITHAEFYSNHPISASLKNFHKCPKCETLKIEDAEEISGHGIKCNVEGKTVLCGNSKLMEKENVSGFSEDTISEGTVIHAAVDGNYAGFVTISDVVKEETPDAIKQLKKAGVHKCVMLTGDNKSVARSVAEKIGMDEFHAELLPQDKVSKMEEILASKTSRSGTVLFTGDGINDAPVLTLSDVGIAMGGLGSDAAIEAADVVLMDDNLSRISQAVKISRKTILNVKENIVLSLGVKLTLLALCAVGMANMWLAIFGDVGVCLIAILNSFRLLAGKSSVKKQREA